MMRKGWKTDPLWVGLGALRAGTREQLRLLQQSAEYQERMVTAHQQVRDEARRHMAECHAQKVLAGEVAEKTVN